MKILVAITGSSYPKIGLQLLNSIPKEHEIYAIISENAKNVLKFEENSEICEIKGVKFLDNSNLAAPVSSGSFGVDCTIVAPCSINSLAKIAAGIADNLILRAAAVALKERKQLILGVREMPFSTISLEQMAKLSSQGVIIAPPILGTYAGSNLEEIENFIVGKWLDLMKIENSLYKRWK